jgi:hypothetical protein
MFQKYLVILGNSKSFVKTLTSNCSLDQNVSPCADSEKDMWLSGTWFQWPHKALPPRGDMSVDYRPLGEEGL